MLSGEGNAGERWKTTIGLISKKATLHVQHTFLYISLPFFCTTTTWNFQKLFSYTFYRGIFFSLLLIFTLHCWPLAFLILSPPLQNFHVVLLTKKCLLCFLSLALDLCGSFSRWASLTPRLLSPFLCLFLALYSKFVDMTIKLSKLNTLDNTDTETISASRFRLYWLFSCLLFTRRRVAMRFPAKISSSCIWVTIPPPLPLRRRLG